MTATDRARAVFRGLALAAVALLLWTTRMGTRWPTFYYMTGPSMEPTVRPGEVFLAWSPAQDLTAGQLVIFDFTDGDGERFHVLRRVAGLALDTVAMEEGVPILNGEPMPWPYRVVAPRARSSPYARVPDLYTWEAVVPPHSVILLSDTRDHLGWPDSRFIGPVPRADVVAVVTRTLGGRSLAPSQTRKKRP